MAGIVEFLTVNVAVKDLDAVANKYRKLGLQTLPPSHMPAPPAEITDVTVPLGLAGAISIIAATGPTSPVRRFLDKRGEGVYSIAVRVDNLEQVMAQWAAAGLEWVLPKPYEFPPGTPAARYLPQGLKANWVKPSSLNGVMLECFEFVGEVHPHEPQ
jgi:4-hydroxyphenylpyruvate dioxygenase-like putative hemolysin